MLQFLKYVGFRNKHLYHLPLCASNRASIHFSSAEDFWIGRGRYTSVNIMAQSCEAKVFEKLGDDFKVYGDGH